MNMLKVPSSAAAVSPPSEVVPQADSSSVAATPAATSAPVRVLDLTGHAS
jgi:hypothetical protein